MYRQKIHSISSNIFPIIFSELCKKNGHYVKRIADKVYEELEFKLYPKSARY